MILCTSCGSGTGGGDQASPIPHLKYFGYVGIDVGYDDPLDAEVKTNYLDETAYFTNIAHIGVSDPSTNIGPRLDAFAAHDVAGLLDLTPIFYEEVVPPIDITGSGVDLRLRSDYIARWNQLRTNSDFASRLSTIGCFYLCDEPTWRGVTASELALQANVIQATYPTVPTLVVEAYPAINLLVIPASVDWIAFDRYFILDPSTDGNYLKDLADLKSKRSSLAQKIVLILDGQWLPGHGYPETDMAQVATNYYRLASTDPEIVGLIGYLWPGGVDGPTSLGTRNMPIEVQAEHVRIGRAITGKRGVPN